MNKYTNEQLQEMAKAFIGMYDVGVDIRPSVLIEYLSFITNTTPVQCLVNIRAMARGEFENA